MSTALLEQTAKSEPHATPAGAGINDVNPLDVIDLSSVSTEDAYRTLSAAASSTGVALINNLPLRAPIGAIQKLFGRLYADPALASRLNATYPTRGVFKAACLDPASSPKVDQKTTIDLSVNRLEELRRLDPALVEELGQDFSDVLDFYSVVEAVLLPVLTQATSSITGADLAPLHKGVNNNLRLIDYFPSAEPSAPRCGEHRDYGTYTIVFQDRSVGGLEFEIDGKWTQVPASADAVVSWGWCGAVLSDNAVTAAKHRVMKTWPAVQRRTTAVLFVAPDLDAPLKPVNGPGKGWSEDISNGNVNVGSFKQVVARRWRTREGNEAGEVIEGAQDREVEAFLKTGSI